jgi:IgA Peptidase M64/FG-GAP-like repeat
MPDSVTQILRAGPTGTKRNIAVLGDGFGAADQQIYNDKVNDLLINGVFARDYFYEDAQAFNIFRVNLISNQSPISERKYDEHGTPSDASDDTIVSTTLRDTALGYIYSGSWAHCWLEGGANTGTLVQNALDTWVPDYDLVVVILNTTGFGGCGGGGFQIVTRGVSWDVMAHEFGHGTGQLADEYCARPGAYPGGEPGSVNLTINTNRATLKWRQYVDPATPVPTGTGACAGFTGGPRPAGWSDSLDAGLFEGGGTWSTGIYRPAINCRMRGNTPEYCPVCYSAMKRAQDQYTAHTFTNAYAGDFNGDGKDDILLHSDNSILLYRSNGKQLDIAFSAVERVPGSWQFTPGDQFYVADINNDGKDEVIVYNGTNWVMEYLGVLADDGAGGLRLIARYDDRMPGWQFQKDDRFYVADFDGNGRKDLFVFNGSNWSIPYLGMLRSTGTGLALVNRYDGTMPNWQMRPGDRHMVGDFNGDGRDDLWVFNGSDWSFPYLGMLASNGTSLSMTHRYDDTLPNWQMRASDQHFIGDFNGDRKADLFVFNGRDWSIAYLGMLASDGSSLAMTHRYDGTVPGWQMRRNDQHWLADVDGNGRSDLFVYNSQDWYSEYLGTMTSSGNALSARWNVDWIGEWNLGAVDRFEPCDYEGAGGRRDLIVHNRDWLGMIRGRSTSLTLDRLYYRWIHNYRFGRNW